MADVSKTIILKYDVDTKKLIDANGKAVTSIKQLISNTQQAAAATQKMGDAMGKNTEIVLGSAQHLQKQIAYAKQQRQATATNNEEWLRQTMVIRGLENRYQKLTKETSALNTSSKNTANTTRELSKLQENQARASGLAGAAAFELGRTISDLPFGIVAVTNNISQLGTLFAALVANAGGLNKAMKALGRQLIGPAGILVAFQVVTAAITYFAQQSNKAKEAVSKFNIDLASQADLLQRILELKKQGAITSDEELNLLKNYSKINKDIVKLFQEGTISEQEKNDLLQKSYDLAVLKEQEEVKAAARLEKAKGIEEELIGLLERKDELEQSIVYQKTYGGINRAKVIKQNEQELLQITSQIALKESRKADILKQNVLAVGQINEAESEIDQTLSDAIKKKERLLELDKQRESALSDLLDVQISEEEGLVDQAILDEDLEAFKEHYQRLSVLKGEQLFKQREQDLEGVEDPTIINAIEEKYRLLFKALNEEVSEGFRAGLLEMFGGKVDGVFAEKLSLLDLIDGPEQTEAEKWAAGEVKKIGDAVTKEFQKRQSSKGERNFFVDTFGVSQENIEAAISAAQSGLSTLGDLFAAQAEREIAVETNRTNMLNDQLRQRLANEQLTADQRDKINQQIARNQAELVKKENAINKKRFEQEKAVNMAMAVVDTFSAATGVLADTKGGSFARIAGMIAVITAGLANVAMIAKQQFTAKAMPTANLSSQGAGGGTGDRVFNVVGATPQTQIAEAIAATEDKPVKAYVVSSDVTSAQELDRRIVEGASI